MKSKLDAKAKTPVRWVSRETRSGLVVPMPIGGGELKAKDIREAVRTVRDAREKKA
jgi:hypothetical protein